MAGPALGDESRLRTSGIFVEPIASHTVTSIACCAMSSWSLTKPRISTSKSAGLSSGSAHGFQSSDTGMQSQRFSGGSLVCKRVVSMEERELLLESGKRRMPMHIELQEHIVPASYTGSWKYLFSRVGNGCSYTCMQADGNPVSHSFLGSCLWEGSLLRQPPEDFGIVAARASSYRRRPEPLPANLVHRSAYC
jgi:hypothetical protein